MAHILVAENNKTIADYIRSTLKKGFHTLDVADNSLDAWRASGTTAYDVMVISAMMPGIDGFVLAQRALQENPLLQVVFVTGFSAVAMDTRATPPYAPAPLTLQPFHLRDINMKIRQLMNGGPEPCAAPRIIGDGTVVYADFTARPAKTQDAATTAG